MPTVQTRTPEKGLGRTKDPYEAYFRYERRTFRNQVATLVGLLFLSIAVLGGLIFWHLSGNQRVASADTASASLD